MSEIGIGTALGGLVAAGYILGWLVNVLVWTCSLIIDLALGIDNEGKL